MIQTFILNKIQKQNNEICIISLILKNFLPYIEDIINNLHTLEPSSYY